MPPFSLHVHFKQDMKHFIMNKVTFYICDSDEIWGPCILGTLGRTAGTGYHADFPVLGEIYTLKNKKGGLCKTYSHDFKANQPFTQHKADTYWFPAKRNVSRPYKHSIEVVVKDEDSPVDEHNKVDASSCSVKRPVPNN